MPMQSATMSVSRYTSCRGDTPTLSTPLGLKDGTLITRTKYSKIGVRYTFKRQQCSTKKLKRCLPTPAIKPYEHDNSPPTSRFLQIIPRLHSIGRSHG